MDDSEKGPSPDEANHLHDATVEFMTQFASSRPSNEWFPELLLVDQLAQIGKFDKVRSMLAARQVEQNFVDLSPEELKTLIRHVVSFASNAYPEPTKPLADQVEANNKELMGLFKQAVANNPPEPEKAE